MSEDAIILLDLIVIPLVFYTLIFGACVRFVRRERWMIATGLIAFLAVVPAVEFLCNVHLREWYDVQVIVYKVESAPFLLAASLLLPVGLAAGLMRRLAIRHMAGRTFGRPRLMAGVAYVMGLGICACYTIVLIRQDDVPSAECLQSQFHLALRNTNVTMPANPVTELYTGARSIWNEYETSRPRMEKALCDVAADAAKPFRVSSLEIEFYKANEIDGGNYKPILDALCHDSSVAGGKLLCEVPGLDDFKSPRIIGAVFYDPQLYTSAVLLEGLYTKFTAARDAAANAGTPWTPTQAGAFDRYPDGYYIARNAAELPGVGGYPATMKCSEDREGKQYLDCLIYRQVADGIVGMILFDTPAAKLEQSALAAHQAIGELFERMNKSSP